VLKKSRTLHDGHAGGGNRARCSRLAATSTDASKAQPTGPTSLRSGATRISSTRDTFSKHWRRIARVTASSRNSRAAFANLPAQEGELRSLLGEIAQDFNETFREEAR